MTLKKIHLVIYLAFFLMVSGQSGTIHAQEAATWKAEPSRTTVSTGETLVINVTADINEGWHVYSTHGYDEGPVPTTIEFPEGSPLVLAGKVKQPPPIEEFDEAFGINTEYYEDGVTFEVPARVVSGALPGKRTVQIEVTFMACNDRICLPPKTITLDFPLTIEKGAEQATEIVTEDTGSSVVSSPEADTISIAGNAPASTVASDNSRRSTFGDASEVEAAREQGLWAYLLLAMSVGALALLTPCVFPMIPITVSFFTKRQDQDRTRGVTDAFVYSLGIIVTFTGLGVLLAVLFGAAGINQFAANPWMNILIAGIFIVFALNLFGMFEIQLPTSIINKLNLASQKKGNSYVSVLLMGLTFTLTSFTCTVPFVGTVMVAASQGDIWWSLAGMLAFSTVFAIPFFLLALFPSWLKSLPKSGGWMNSIKVVMGFLELAAAMKFISNVDLIWGIGLLNRDFFLAIWIAIGIIVSMYILGKIRLPNDMPVEITSVGRVLFALFFIAVSIFLYTGLNDRPLGELDAFLPPMNYEETIEAASGNAATSHRASGEDWFASLDEAKRVAAAQNKNIFIDFTGFACTNCRWMEANLFTRDDVKELFSRYVLVRLYTDGQGEEYEENRRFQEDRFGTVALPLYVIIDEKGSEIARFPGMTRDPGEFVRFLRQGLSRQEMLSARQPSTPIDTM
ncbi:MAG: cytochrome C biogenesis protein [Chlorobi bacterium]|nr:cytochrome C biogenesis protein [Chlorobiota bacterium]